MEEIRTEEDAPQSHEGVVRVGITGYATAGKDVIADVLVAEYGFTKINMSTALNNYLCILNPTVASNPLVTYADAVRGLGYVQAKAVYPEVRRLLQVMGTEVGRVIDQDMWVKELEKLAVQHKRVVTTGIRYPNEISPNMTPARRGTHRFLRARRSCPHRRRTRCMRVRAAVQHPDRGDSCRHAG